MVHTGYFEAIDHGTHSEYVLTDHNNYNARFGYGILKPDNTWVVHTTKEDAQAYAQHLLEVAAF